jgi:hypothetical protein
MRFQEYLGGSTLMQRRDFLKAGAAGMTLALAEGQSQAQVELRTDVTGADAKDTPEDLSVVVIGTDGSIPAKTVTDRYVAAHADVWHYLPQGARFSQVLEYLDSDPRIKQAKSVADIGRRAPSCANITNWGFVPPTSPISSPISLAAACSTQRRA